jgi:hypothetical protein
LRALLESLQLEVAYHPGGHALDVTVTLYDADGASAAEEDWTVPPALHNANLSALVTGEVIALPGVHAKVRRAGYVSPSAV